MKEERDSLNAAAGGGGTVTIRGKMYDFRVPKFRDFKALEQRVRKRRIQEIMDLGFPPERENELIMKTQTVPIDIDDEILTIDGMGFIIYCALKENEGMTEEKVFRIISPNEAINVLNTVTQEETMKEVAGNPPAEEASEPPGHDSSLS